MIDLLQPSDGTKIENEPELVTDQPTRHIPHLLLIGVTTLVVLAVLILSAAFFLNWRYHNVLTPGTSVGIIDVSRLTMAEAEALVRQQMTAIETEGITISEPDSATTVSLRANLGSLSDPDVARDLFIYNLPETVSPLNSQIDQGSRLSGLIARVAWAIQRPTFLARFDLDADLAAQSLNEGLAAINRPAQNARPEISWNGDQPVITIVPETSGQIIDHARVIAELESRLAYLDPTPISAETTVDLPTITASDVASLNTDLADLLATSTGVLVFEKGSWSLTARQLAPMIIFDRNTDDRVIISIDFTKWKNWVDQNIATTVAIEPQDAKMEMIDGRIQNISAHRAGRIIDYERTHQVFIENLSTKIATDIVTTDVEPSITTANVNDLGIKEIIGIGRSNFAGSPTNRRHNIATGAKKLHGVLVKPGEEFSLITTLGEIDGTNGYRTELVIKGNKTTPEYGGGLCQIGTTSFRAALGSGLPITERRNHSYSVGYYLENGLPGVDATIYDPKPDLRFLNDTGAHVLIQTRITGDDLTFEFWGTKDGRVATRTAPRTWGRIAAPATKYIETTDLKPGEKKCTESAHAGISAAFDYIVTYANGEEKKNTFTSVYRPWQAVCLIGVASLTPSTTTDPSIAPVTP